MNLTDRTFWLKYWENKEDLNIEIPENYILSANLKDIQKSRPFKNAIELGGFPGYYSIYLKKWLEVDTTLLDYVIHPKIIEDVLFTIVPIETKWFSRYVMIPATK